MEHPKLYSIANLPAGRKKTQSCCKRMCVIPWQVQELAEAMSRDGAAAAREEETSAETWMLPYDVRRERYSGPVRCRYCCGCCALGVCGMCCE
uniref:Hepcidin n=1 Tax=Scophthalmus maximus TaxID=52904 RepID=A0A8D3A6H9_SCOMX